MTAIAEKPQRIDLQVNEPYSKTRLVLGLLGRTWLWFLAASVVGLFESTIAQFTALAVLLPVVAGQSGNAGAQALAVTMRGLALREVRVRHWARIGGKELMVGAINGVAVAAVTALGVWLWSGSSGLAAVMGVSMVCSMVVAGLAGASVPMALTLLGQDPAAASSIILK